jgi:hypothetical protein
MSRDPIILGMCDFFERPAPFRADLVVPIDDVADQVVALLACHESQVFEWLPHVMGLKVGTNRVAWLKAFYSKRCAEVARRYAQSNVHNAEAYELSEYGRQVDPGELSKLLTNNC